MANKFSTILTSTQFPDKELLTGDSQALDSHPAYCNLLQGKGPNALARISNKSFIVDPMTGVATAEYGGVCVQAEDLNTLNLSNTTLKLFDFLISRLTLNFPNGENIPANQIDARRMLSVSVREFMDICGLSDYKNAKEQFISSLRSLSQLKLKWVEAFTFIPPGAKRAIRQEIPWETYVFDSTQDQEITLKRGRAYLKLSYDLAKYYTQSQVIPHALEAFKLDNREEPHAYRIFHKIEEHHAQNILKPNANRISVLKLLEAAPDIPRYEDVRAGASQVKREIIDRFDGALITLQKKGLLKDWWYCNANGAPLSESQTDDYSYKEWSTWLVEFRMADNYPEDEQRERKEKGRKIKTEKKKEAEKRAQKAMNKTRKSGT